jgi:hypothetical protein
MANPIPDLNQIANCVRSAQLHAIADHWHLTERALPPLRAIVQDTEDPRLHAAAENTATATDHLSAAKIALKSAAELIEKCAADQPVTAR